MTRLAAIVLAAGRSSRMGELKPLLPLGDATVLARAVGAFTDAGVDDVRVVVGWCGDEVGAAAVALGATVVVNDGWKRGMFSSVAAGVAAPRRRRRRVLSVADRLRPGACRDDRPPGARRARTPGPGRLPGARAGVAATRR